MNIIDRFDEYMTRSKERTRRSHHPSDVTACLRQLAYKWNTPESDPPTANNFIKMAFGNIAEAELLQPWLKWEQEQGHIIHLETQSEINGVEPDLKYSIHGYQDFVFKNLKGETIAIECKSTFGRGIVDIQRRGEPKPEHLMQVYLYLKYGTADRYYLVYIGRDNGYRCQFEILRHEQGLTYNGKVFKVDHEALIHRLSMAEASIGEDILPEREFKAAIRNGEIVDKFQRDNVEYKGMWQCSYCNHRSTCWAEQLKGGVWYGEERIG